MVRRLSRFFRCYAILTDGLANMFIGVLKSNLNSPIPTKILTIRKA